MTRILDFLKARSRRIVMSLAGVVICFGSALYMTADLGVSTYDAVAIVMSSKWKWGKFKYIRIGTIITAFFMGPLIDLFNRKIARPMLEYKKK